MADIAIGGVQPYTITLDNIELSYLSKYITSNRMEKKPLWTKHTLNGENEYYQVQIDTGNGNENCYFEPFDTYECHICNTHVPTMYSKEHNNSERHETLKHIFQEILKRLSKQMNTDITDIDNDVSNIMYFCVTCSKIIKIENKSKHESSDYHVKTQKDMNVAKEFYKTLQERKEVGNEIYKDEDSNPESKFVSKSTPNRNDDTNHTLFKTCSSSSLESDDEPKDFTIRGTGERVSPSHNDEKAIVNVEVEKLKNFEEYLKEMIKTYKLNANLPVVSGESICLVTPSGNKLNVSSEHFHSYRKLADRVYCQLCKLWVPLDTRSHDVTENHVRRIFSPINENFARTINNVTSHCVPCNDVILTDSDHHSINDNHKKIIKENCVIYPGKTYCDDCNIYIDTHNFNVHTKSKKHLTVFMEKHSVSERTENIVYCNTCKISMHKNDLSNHVNSKAHAAKKNDDSTKVNNKTTKVDITNNNSTKVNNKSNEVDHTSNISSKVNNNSPSIDVVSNPDYCETCKVNVPRGGMKTHVNGKPHKTVLSGLKAKNKNELKTEESKAENTVKALSRIEDNRASTSAVSNVRSRPSNATSHEYYCQLQFTDNTKTKVKCKICLIVIDFVESRIIEHMEGKRHVETAKIKMGEYPKFLFYANEAKTKLKCTICDVHLPSVDRNIIEHMEGKYHKEEEDILIRCHKMKRNQLEFTCDCCNIDTEDYFEHINSRKHVLTYFKKYNFDRKLFRKYIYETNEGGGVAKRIRDLYKNVLKHNGIDDKKEQGFYCSYCEIKLERISEIDHVLEERHVNLVSALSNFADFVESTLNNLAEQLLS